MAFKKMMERLTKPTEERDREELTAWCNTHSVEPLDSVELRQPVAVAGEVRSVRIVPRAGAAALEVSVSDGRGAVTAVFLGRRKIAGLSPGRRVLLNGVIALDGAQRVMYNPIYALS